MEKKRKGLGYEECAKCESREPEGCVACRLPERESEKWSIIPQKKPKKEPEGGGWRM